MSATTAVTKGSAAGLGIPDVRSASEPTSLALLASAIERGVPVEAVEKLVQLHREEQDRSAAREFAADLAEFQAHCPPIQKTSTAKIVSESKGSSFTYKYAELDEIARTVQPHLHARGFSYAWDSESNEHSIAVTCVLRHRNGHAERARFSCPIAAAGRMNPAQQHAAALTYAKRQALIQVLGITTTETDTDAAAHEYITLEQADQILNLAAQVGAKLEKVLAWQKVDAVSHIRADQYGAVVEALNKFARQRAG